MAATGGLRVSVQPVATAARNARLKIASHRRVGERMFFIASAFLQRTA